MEYFGPILSLVFVCFGLGLLAFLVERYVDQHTDPRTQTREWCPPGFPVGWGYYDSKPSFPEHRPTDYFRVGEEVWIRQDEKGAWCSAIVELADTASDTLRVRCMNRWNRCPISRHTLVVGHANDRLWPKFRFQDPIPHRGLW